MTIVRFGVLAVLLLLACRPDAGNRTQSPAARRASPQLTYWRNVVGVSDQEQLARLEKIEQQQNRRYRRLQGRLAALRQQLKIGLTEGTLKPVQVDSFLQEIARINQQIEQDGISAWQALDSLLTPEQRQRRLAYLKGPAIRPAGRDSTSDTTP